MKKFFIIFTVVILVIAGALAYIAFSNQMFMTLAITQNKDKAIEAMTESFEKYSEADYYDYKFSLSYTNEDGDSSTGDFSLKLVRVEDGFDFIAVQTTKYTQDDEDVTENISLYYTDGVLYTKDGDTETQATTDLDQALSRATGDLLEMLMLSDEGIFDDTEMLEESEFKICYKFSFSPFYLGQTFRITPEVEEAAGFTFDLKFDMAKNFRGVYSSGTYDEGITVTISTDLLSVNKKIVLDFPTDLEDYVVVPEP